MTTLQDAATKALEYAEAQCGGRCNAEYNPCHAYEIADCLRTALAQQGEPGAWKCCPPGKCAHRISRPKENCPRENLPAPQAQQKAMPFVPRSKEAEMMESWAAQPAPQPSPPHECSTEAEKLAYAAGWWKALEVNRVQLLTQPQESQK